MSLFTSSISFRCQVERGMIASPSSKEKKKKKSKEEEEQGQDQDDGALVSFT